MLADSVERGAPRKLATSSSVTWLRWPGRRSFPVSTAAVNSVCPPSLEAPRNWLTGSSGACCAGGQAVPVCAVPHSGRPGRDGRGTAAARARRPAPHQVDSGMTRVSGLGSSPSRLRWPRRRGCAHSPTHAAPAWQLYGLGVRLRVKPFPAAMVKAPRLRLPADARHGQVYSIQSSPARP